MRDFRINNKHKLVLVIHEVSKRDFGDRKFSRDFCVFWTDRWGAVEHETNINQHKTSSFARLQQKKSPLYPVGNHRLHVYAFFFLW